MVTETVTSLKMVTETMNQNQILDLNLHQEIKNCVLVSLYLSKAIDGLLCQKLNLCQCQVGTTVLYTLIIRLCSSEYNKTLIFYVNFTTKAD